MQTQNQADGTVTLLRTGLGVFAAGAACLLLAETVLGGIDRHGPHTNSGWLALIVALMCMPFGLMLLGLGGAKWLRNRE
jgi:uncharacterized membrane protein YidH (DUF202 family)